MTVVAAKAIFVVCVIAFWIIRSPHQRRAGRIPVRLSKRDTREWLLLASATIGLAVLPGIFVFSRTLRAADYPFRPALAWIGAGAFGLALWLFYRAHRDLGGNFSPSLEVRDDHRLVTGGIYAHVRHPMYSAFWLWGVAQALLLANWIAGPAGLVGFGILFVCRIGREERLMIEQFGQDYRSYMSRTGRVMPWIC